LDKANDDLREMMCINKVSNTVTSKLPKNTVNTTRNSIDNNTSNITNNNSESENRGENYKHNDGEELKENNEGGKDDGGDNEDGEVDDGNSDDGDDDDDSEDDENDDVNTNDKNGKENEKVNKGKGIGEGGNDGAPVKKKREKRFAYIYLVWSPFMDFVKCGSSHTSGFRFRRRYKTVTNLNIQ